MEYQDNIDDLLSDALSLNTRLNADKIIKPCNLPHDIECDDDLLRLSAQSIPTVFNVNSVAITIPDLPIITMKSYLSEKTKYLTTSLTSINSEYVNKLKGTFNKAFPLIAINVNKLHTFYAIYKLGADKDKPHLRRSVYAELFTLTLNRMGRTTLDDPKTLYEFLTLISLPFDWVDIYNLITKYKEINFLLFMLNTTAKLFENNKNINDTPLVVMHYTNSKTIDLVHAFEKGSKVFANVTILD